MSKSSDEKVIYLKNAGKEINTKSHLPPGQMSVPHMVYSIAAQMVEHKGDPGTWKSTQGKVLDRAQFKRLRVTSKSTQPQRVTLRGVPGPGEITTVHLLLSRESLQGTQAFLSVEGSGWVIVKSQTK